MQLLIQEAVKKFTPAFINIWRLGVTLCLLFVLLFIFLPNLQSIFNPNSSLLLWAAIAAFLGPFMARLFYSYACQILPAKENFFALSGCSVCIKESAFSNTSWIV